MTAKMVEIGPFFCLTERNMKWESILYGVRLLRSWSGK